MPTMESEITIVLTGLDNPCEPLVTTGWLGDDEGGVVDVDEVDGKGEVFDVAGASSTSKLCSCVSG